MRKTRFRHYHQLDTADCGPASLRMIASYYGREISFDLLRERCEFTREGVNLYGISKAAESLGFRTLGARLSFEQLAGSNLPAIIHWHQHHFVVLYKIKQTRKGKLLYIADPATGLVKLNEKEFVKSWCTSVVDNEAVGIALFLEVTPEFYHNPGEQAPKREGFKFLIPYFKPYSKLIIQLFAALFTASLVQLIFPFLTQSIVDTGIGYKDLNFIWLVLIAQFILVLSLSTVEFIRGWILLYLGTRINISLISGFLMKLMKLPVGFFDTKMTGDLLQRIGDHRKIQNFLTGSSLNILFSLFNILIFSGVLLYYSPLIFAVFLLASSIYLIWVLLFMKKRRELNNKEFTQNAANQNAIIQLITGMQEIKLSGCEREKRWEWERIQARLYRIGIKVLALGQYQEGGAALVNQLKNIVITFIAASSVIDNKMTLGMMLSVQYIIGQLNAPVINIVEFIKASQDAKISLERLEEIHHRKDEEGENGALLQLSPGERDLVIRNLSFKYSGAGSPMVLKNINFTLPKSKVTAIVGSSGSGKTTLVKLLLGFYPPTEGEILYGEDNFNLLSMERWRKGCGVVMQDGFIFSDTIAKNIAPSGDSTDYQRLVMASEIANITEFTETMPLGFNTRIGQEGHGLSQGQKQRILIARALYKNPGFLIFDEATNSLDANNERDIMEKLFEFFRGRSVLIVAHRLSTVVNADNIVVLDKGSVVESGNHAELLEKRGYYYKLVKNQLYV
ncbi:MAG: peptidase domain-containing ABC transporter [Bacteroidales bacterium]|nr:peptidase domain-containing ABC transporter [Bacteroidales bacterium]MDD2425046.1 peptidase domain-containing ABC transporter [Bacteroidales bacterium]MDD3988645.1 peptidase domain-containing ABC transporter [Bacteroidales bacterium]